jgi:hypothetical protein
MAGLPGAGPWYDVAGWAGRIAGATGRDAMQLESGLHRARRMTPASRAAALLAFVALLSWNVAPGAASGPASPAAQVRDGDVARAIVEQVRADAAHRAGVALTETHILRVEARDWSDTSLGCPLPGRQYAQVVTPGYLVVAWAAGRELAYHTDTRHMIVLCERSANQHGAR